MCEMVKLIHNTNALTEKQIMEEKELCFSQGLRPVLLQNGSLSIEDFFKEFMSSLLAGESE